METDDQMWALPYYHGLLPREDVNPMLVRDGDFLIRKSEETDVNPMLVRDGDFEETSGQERIVLSVYAEEHPQHIILRMENGLVAVDFSLERGYRTIQEFVDVHRSNGYTVIHDWRVVLLRGIGRQTWELAHSDITQGAQLGKGAFGVVMRGVFTDPINGQSFQVAIKKTQTSTKAEIEEFMNEARIMRQLEHKNVIKFFGVAVGREPLMLLMELASDGSLDDYLKKTKQSPRSKLFMCLGAAAGLDHVHTKGILHCDIAARNCLFSQNTVKIADFGLAFNGLAKPMEDGKAALRWLSPETIQERAFAVESDVWAYGVLCWEIYSNAQQPYHGLTDMEVLQMVVQGTRLRFPSTTPQTFVEFIKTHVWTGDEAHYSMRDVVAWIERHIDDLAAGATTCCGRTFASRYCVQRHQRTNKHAYTQKKSP